MKMSFEGLMQINEGMREYRQMMEGLKKAVPEKARVFDEALDKFVKLLKREYRIVWAIRWYRVNELERMQGSKRTESIDKLLKKYALQIAKKRGEAIDTIIYESSMLLGAIENLKHYMAYVDQDSGNYIPEIAKIVFDYQSPAEIIDEMAYFEREWQETRKREVPYASAAK